MMIGDIRSFKLKLKNMKDEEIANIAQRFDMHKQSQLTNQLTNDQPYVDIKNLGMVHY